MYIFGLKLVILFSNNGIHITKYDLYYARGDSMGRIHHACYTCTILLLSYVPHINQVFTAPLIKEYQGNVHVCLTILFYTDLKTDSNLNLYSHFLSPSFYK